MDLRHVAPGAGQVALSRLDANNASPIDKSGSRIAACALEDLRRALRITELPSQLGQLRIPPRPRVLALRRKFIQLSFDDAARPSRAGHVADLNLHTRDPKQALAFIPAQRFVTACFLTLTAAGLDVPDRVLAHSLRRLDASRAGQRARHRDS